MAMRTSNGNMHLEIQTSRKSPVGILRSTYWDKKQRKIRHDQLCRLKGCSLDQLKILQLAFREQVVPANDASAFKILASRELGASRAVLGVMADLGLGRILYSRKVDWAQYCLAMIAGRIVYQGSKLSLCNLWKDTLLWELCGVRDKPDVDKHCYQPMDELLARRKTIQKKLAARHLKGSPGNEVVLLYDITSSYFEGEYADSGIVDYGYNRDRKRGTKQIVVALLCNAQGCPVACEVMAGNTNDSSTVQAKVKEIHQTYGVEKCVFVGDRGMLTQNNLESLEKDPNLFTLTALTHSGLRKLLEADTIQMELFDEKNIVEVEDPETPGLRYCLCKNPHTAEKESKTRKRLLELTAEQLKKIAAYKRSTTTEKLGARVGKVLAKYKMGKFVEWEIKASPDGEKSSRAHELVWRFDEAKIQEEARLDGCYIVRTTVDRRTMDTRQVVDSYKALGQVERAFRNLKTVALEMRPFHHKKDDRIRAHVFLCMLAYYVQWHMHKALAPLYEKDGEGARRRWSFQGVLSRLKSITSNRMRVGKVEFEQASQPDEEQREIIELLKKAV